MALEEVDGRLPSRRVAGAQVVLGLCSGGAQVVLWRCSGGAQVGPSDDHAVSGEASVRRSAWA